MSNTNMGHPIHMTGTLLDRVAEDSKPIIGCASNNHLEDIDGVLGPSNKGSGFIVSDNADMTSFLSECTSIGTSCSAFCENACLRTVKIKPGHPDVKSMELTNINGVKHDFTSSDMFGAFFVVLPKGSYRVRFFDIEGNHIAQIIGSITFFEVPLCQDYITASDFTFQGVAWDTDQPYEVLHEATGGCPAGKSITTVEECKLAGESLSLNLRSGSVVVGTWWMVPCGCALGGADTSVHFDSNIHACNDNDGTWRSICKRTILVTDWPTTSPTPMPTSPTVSPTSNPVETPSPYEVLQEVTGGCPAGKSITTVEECKLAGESLSLTLRDNEVVVASFWMIPCGCALGGADTSVHFDSNFNACNDNDGTWRSICKIEGSTHSPTARPSTNPTLTPSPYEVLQEVTGGCQPGWGISSVEECKVAGESLGLTLRDNEVVEASYWMIPCGCALGGADTSVHFDSNFNACNDNDGTWRSICRKPTYEMLQEATGSCPAGKEITTVEECKLAGESLSLNLRSGSVVVGSWWMVPCGCASYPGGDVHFDTNFNYCGPDQNDGNWRSICKQIEGVTSSPTYAPTPFPSSSPIAPSPYEVLQEVTGGCPAGKSITTVEECKLAGESLSLTLRDNEVVVASFWMIPCGCALGGADTSVHFDSNFNACNDNDGTWRSICKIEGSTHSPTARPSTNPTLTPSPYEVLQEVTGGCQPGWGISSVEECKVAGESLGLTLRDNEVVEASYWMIPCGCALGGADTSVHFDSNFNACNDNDGTWRSICRKPTYEMLQEATGSCPAGKEITTVEECKLAGESLSLNLRSGSVVVGSWWMVPCGCASYPGGDVHFDTNFNYCGPDQNDGNWRSICKGGMETFERKRSLRG